MDPVAAAVLASWTLDLRAVCLLLVVASLYLRGWLRLRAELPHKYTAGRLAAFAGGLFALLSALASPVDAFGGLLLTAHMIQHLLLLMVAPALLLLGQPVLPLLRGLPRWVFKDALGPFLASREFRQVGRAMVHPVVSWLALASVITIWHMSPVYELALRSQAWHEVEHACFFWAAIMFWWPVVGVWPGHAVWPRWTMIPYLALADLVNTGLSAVLSFSDHVLYPSYQLAPRLWGISALDDQATAGAIMWVPGSIAFLVPAVILGMRALEAGRTRPLQRTTTRRSAVMRHIPAGKPWDLLRTPILGPILRYRHFRRCLQAAMLLLAGAVAVDGLFGPQVTPMNLAGVLPWTHWRGLAVIALLLAGNLFCMACPFTLPRDLARRVVAPRYRWPRRLRSKWIAAGLLATYLWAYEAFSLWDSPRATAWIILGYFIAAFVVDILFKGASFCKYMCPIGQFHFVHSLVSPLQVRVREPAVCGSCSTHDCIRGNGHQRGCELNLFQPKKLGNFDCTFCLDCVQACPTQNVGILTGLPGQSLREEHRGSGIGRLNRRPDVAALVLILVFGAFVNAAGMTDPVMMWMHRWHGRLRLGSMVPIMTAVYLCGVLIVPGILATACGWVSQCWKRETVTRKELACSFTLALIPVGFGMWLAHFSNHLATGWSSFVPAIERFLSRDASADYPPGPIPGWLPSVELLFLGMGLLLTLHSAWRVACRISEGRRRAVAVMSPWAVVAGALYSAGVWIVFQPMQMRGTMMMR
ncbi:MAG: yccM [Candidatus Solibacter sp.]|nr:yccM [Candidatus Solibacter sp.]